jgi:hypothetical protein
LLHRAGVHFIDSKFLNPAGRRAKMPAAFCGGFLK